MAMRGSLVAGISAMTSLLIDGNLNERERQAMKVKIAQAADSVVKKVEDKLKITNQNLEAMNEDVKDLKRRVRILEQGRVAVDKLKSVEFAHFAMQRLTGSTSNSFSPARFPSTPLQGFHLLQHQGFHHQLQGFHHHHPILHHHGCFHHHPFLQHGGFHAHVFSSTNTFHPHPLTFHPHLLT